MNSLQGNNAPPQEGRLGEPTLGTIAPEANKHNFIRRLSSFGFHTVSSLIKRPDRVSRYSSGFWMFACDQIPAVHSYSIGQRRTAGPWLGPAAEAATRLLTSLICREPSLSPSRRKSALVLPFSSKSVCSMWRRIGSRARQLAGNEMNTHHGWRVNQTEGRPIRIPHGGFKSQLHPDSPGAQLSHL